MNRGSQIYNNNNNNNKHLYSACSTECAHSELLLLSLVHGPGNNHIPSQPLCGAHIPCCLYGAGGFIQPYNILVLHCQTRWPTSVKWLASSQLGSNPGHSRDSRAFCRWTTNPGYKGGCTFIMQLPEHGNLNVSEMASQLVRSC